MSTKVGTVHSLWGSGRRNLIIWSVIDFASNRLDLCMENRSIVVPFNRWHTKRKMDFNAPAVRNMPVEHVSRKQERKKSKTEARAADKTERGALWAAVSEKAFLVVGSGCSIVEEPSIRNSSYLHPPPPISSPAAAQRTSWVVEEMERALRSLRLLSPEHPSDHSGQPLPWTSTRWCLILGKQCGEQRWRWGRWLTLKWVSVHGLGSDQPLLHYSIASDNGVPGRGVVGD